MSSWRSSAARVRMSATIAAVRRSSSRRALAPNTLSSRSTTGSAASSRNLKSRTGNRVRLLGLPMRSLVLMAIVAMLATYPVAAAKNDPEKLPPTRVRDLHYGDVLFYVYKDEDFEAITQLTAYEHWNLMPHHAAESQLLLGGLYLSLGLHNEAGELFEKLLTQDIPAGVRNRAWFYLAQVWYARGYLELYL